MSDGDVMGALLRSMLGPGSSEGPPYTLVHQFPPPAYELDADGEEVEVHQPPPPTFTVAAGRTRGRQYENGPLEVPGEFTGNVGCYFPLTDAG